MYKKIFLTFNTFVQHFCTIYQKFRDLFCDIDLFCILTPVVSEKLRDAFMDDPHGTKYSPVCVGWGFGILT